MLYAPSIQQSAPYRQGVPDGTLVKRALAGDQSAFDVLVHRYRTTLAAYIGGFFKDSEQVADVLQHVYLQLYLSLPILLTNVSLHAWLFQVARNYCLDELRRRPRQAAVPFSMLEWEDGEEELSIVAAIPDPGPLPEEVISCAGHWQETRALQPSRRVKSVVRNLYVFDESANASFHYTRVSCGQRARSSPGCRGTLS